MIFLSVMRMALPVGKNPLALWYCYRHMFWWICDASELLSRAAPPPLRYA